MRRGGVGEEKEEEDIKKVFSGQESSSYIEEREIGLAGWLAGWSPAHTQLFFMMRCAGRIGGLVWWYRGVVQSHQRI